MVLKNKGLENMKISLFLQDKKHKLEIEDGKC